jgi:hypothetical protein
MSIPDKSVSSVSVDGDILGTWLMCALTGKRTYHLFNKDGQEVSGDDVKVPGVYSSNVTTNSMDEPFGMGSGCIYEIAFHWDQWFVCTITCKHGTHEGTSDFFNMTEALMRAVETFNEVDHPHEVPDAVESAVSADQGS